MQEWSLLGVLIRNFSQEMAPHCSVSLIQCYYSAEEQLMLWSASLREDY